MVTLENASTAGKFVGDVLSLSIAIGSLAQVFPPLAALASIIWIGIQIYDRFWGKGRNGRSAADDS